MSDEIHQDGIDAILDDAIRRIRSGEPVETKGYCQLYPDLADEIQLLMPAILLLERPVAQAAKAKVPLPRVQDYDIFREIGRGAMGVVYEAVQKQLNRRVALKVIRVIADDQLQFARFCREASTAARLHHPNIASVFDSGKSEGLAWYSMQLIKGRTLQQILMGSRFDVADRISRAETHSAHDSTKDHHQRSAAHGLTDTAGKTSEATPQNQSLAAQSKCKPQAAFELTSIGAAKLILQVAEALAYAHRQGVLHRDIKPSNIMVDDQGCAWITDFGLAWHADAESLTANGDIVGTVRYLAPEGFSGESSEQSDMYSLGLTLFELIEGQPAFSHTDRACLIREILEGKAPQLTVDVPVDLSTICGKCIQRNAADRYATADLLVSDLRSFLAGRPITARRLGSLQKAVRWCSRNRLVTALAALVILVGTCGFVANRWSSRDAQRLKAESKANSDLARTNLRMLLKTVDRFCQTVSEDRRLYSPEFQELRNLLLESAADLNTQFIENPAVSQEATLQLAGIFHRLGGLGSTRETLAESEDYLIKARNLLLGLPKKEQEQPDVALELLGCSRDLGRVYARMSEVELSRTNLQDAIRIADRIIITNDEEDEEIDIAARLEKARSLCVLGNLSFDLREFEQSETSMNEAVRLLAEIARVRPDDLDVTIELANQWTRLGIMLTANLKKWKQAEVPFREAAKLYEIVRRVEKPRPDVEFSYAVLLQRSSKWLYMSGQLQTAIDTQQQAIDILQNLTDDFDYDLAFQLEYGIALRQLADFLTVQDKQNPKITQTLDRSEAVLTIVVANDNTDVQRVMALANSCLAHAEALQRQGRPDDALARIERAISTLNLILNHDPTNVLARELRYFAAVTRAELLTDLVRYDDSLAEWDVAIQLAPSSFADLTSMKRTRTQALSGDVIQATEQADEILSRQPSGKKSSIQIVSGAARTFAIAATVSGLIAANPDDEGPGELYARRAVALLQQFCATGTGQDEFVSSCDDFDCLRNRPDFLAATQPSASPAQ